MLIFNKMNAELGENASKSFLPHVTNRRPVKLTRSKPQKIVNRLEFVITNLQNYNFSIMYIKM
jgi:hypothetical protein